MNKVHEAKSIAFDVLTCDYQTANTAYYYYLLWYQRHIILGYRLGFFFFFIHIDNGRRR